MVYRYDSQTEVLETKKWLVAVGIVVIVASFLIAHWVSWLLLFAGVGMTAYGVTSKDRALKLRIRCSPYPVESRRRRILHWNSS